MNSRIAPVRAARHDVFISRKEELTWKDASKPGLRLAPVHENRETGRFLGLLGFEAMTNSGLHQHGDVGFSYLLSGSIRDYAGKTEAGEMGINLPGATHDAIAYVPSVVASRLDGHVLYVGEGESDAPHLHAGGRFAAFTNQHPEEAPTINIAVERIPASVTRVAGLLRRMISDYRGTAHDFRNVALTLIPGTHVPAFQTRAPIEIFVIAGALEVNGQVAPGGGFCMIEGDAQVKMSSGAGTFLVAWSEAPVQWLDEAVRPDPFGF
jgi:hypothetical protein